MNSMERILEWHPKGLHKLSMINERQDILMEKSLGNTIPLHQYTAGIVNGNIFITTFKLFAFRS